jgi:mono/diheme cytochrome c family protein
MPDARHTNEEAAMSFPRFLISAAALSLAATSAFAQQKANLGKLEFESKCAACHGKDAKGDGPFATELKRPPSDLTTLAKRNGGTFPAPRVYDMIEGSGKGHGPREMPVWGMDFTIRAAELYPDSPVNQASYVRGRISALVDYLAQLQVK